MFLTQPKMTDKAMLMVMTQLKTGVKQQVSFINTSTLGLITHFNQLVFLNKELAKRLKILKIQKRKEDLNV